MKKRLVVSGISILAAVLALSGQTPRAGSGAAQANAKTTISSADAEYALLDEYCMTCHQGTGAPAGMELDKLDTADVEKNAEKWEKVVRKAARGHDAARGQAPAGCRDVRSHDRYGWKMSSTGTGSLRCRRPGLHRLNRTEYANAIRDLLALEIDPSKYLPSDDSTRGFDNIAGALTLSPALLEGYTSAAGKISRMAVGESGHGRWAPFRAYRVPEDTSQDYHIEGMPFGTRGGMLVKHEFPADGEYAFKITPINKGNMGNTNPFGEIPRRKDGVPARRRAGEAVRLGQRDGSARRRHVQRSSFR